MHHFFTEPSCIQGDVIRIEGGDVNHIRNVLRMKPGEEISVSVPGDDREYRCGIEEIGEDEVICSLRFIKEEGVELPYRITLFQGLPKADKMELIIQKAVELGAYEIVPVKNERCVVKLDDKKAAQKAARWQGISEAAAKQSRRGVIPQVSLPVSMKEAVMRAKEMTLACIPYELAEGMEATKAFTDRMCEEKKGSLGIFIGPEGGFTKEEVELAAAAGVRPISLGRRILRTETAGMTMLSIIMYELEVMA
ncbi:MAG: 16S rRNA (uracil(1498)-N(3))-methyltransferase [Lachnospiraceae bacterium]|nr:16S rRNA (uracil(1498)-N(3))-methyltransferase [Lachnospiraceae bacterium]